MTKPLPFPISVNEKMITRHMIPDDDYPMLAEMANAMKLAHEMMSKAASMTGVVLKTTSRPKLPATRKRARRDLPCLRKRRWPWIKRIVRLSRNARRLSSASVAQR